MEGVFKKSINATFVALIPKKLGAEELNDFRPISLVAGVYKIIAKLLAERLKKVMHKLVNKQQMPLSRADDAEDGFWSKMVKVDQTSHKFSGILYSDQQKTMWVFPIKHGFETRGPLSPFLFILVMEGLSNLFQIAKANGWIKGFKVGENTRNNLEITHLYL
nr:uncharacterized protein LOC112940690 [Solanum lycopersicum]